VSVFRRRRSSASDNDAFGDGAPGNGASGEDSGEELAPDAEPDPQVGPYDEHDAPVDEMPRVDLGGLRVPAAAGVEVRVDVSPEGQIVAATLIAGESGAQVGAFAAPRSSGIWDEVRREILASVAGNGGRAVEVKGTFGTELHAQVPAEGGLVPARFFGVDGPRWLLRGLITGPAAVDAGKAAPLEAAVRQIVVVRGSDPMAVRDPLPLTLPRDVLESAAASSGGPQGQLPRPPARGPEISETR